MKSTLTGGANGANNGNVANGYFSGPNSPSTTRYSVQGGSRKSVTSRFSLGQSSSNEKTNVVRDTAIALKRKSASELGAGVSETADKVSFINLVEWIRAERLSSLPHKGSRWDTVLIRALYFAERLHGFETTLKGHAADSDAAAQLGYGHARLLLELGHENSAALDKAFGFLYRYSSAVTSLLSRSEVLKLSQEIYEEMCKMYSDLLTLVVDVSVRFYKAVHSSSGASASLDLFEVFGDTIATFRHRRDSITELIWKQEIAGDNSDIDEAIEVSTLDRWLAPQDRVLATLELDHTLIADNLAEHTCVWFSDDLAKFVKGTEHSLLINGAPGSGKTTLAAALAERLQRPVARKSYAMLFYSVGAVPSQSSTLNVVKALLHQLLTIRVGNMHLYHAIAQAHEKSRFTQDPAKYEELLWTALEDALRHPLDKGADVVMIVEGLDELPTPNAGQALLQRLVKAVGQGVRVKLIALSQSLSLPTGVSGVQRSIGQNDTRDDIHSVAIRALAQCPHFRSKTGREQETIVSRIIETSEGSFLWAILACESLRLLKTADSFNKAINNLQNPKDSVEDLVQGLVAALELNEEAKLLLAWLVHVARPLTYSEIESLFTMHVHSGTRSDRRVDVHRIVHTLSPLLVVEEDIVRPRHQIVQTAVRNLLKQGKLTVPVKDLPTDVLLRLLTYAKISLPENKEPTLDDSDRSIVDHCFSRYPFLEYVVRYWTWHLQQASVITLGKPDLKITPEIQKVFPESTTLPVLEWLCWDDQFPGAQEVELHDIVGKLRAKILTEKHPSVLQSYINTTAYYEAMQDIDKASHLYYLISTIGRDVLSVSHPIVIECATRFLHLSYSRITTTRTQIVTFREQILILLISAYERQYGVSSEIVVQTREQLAELYLHINEEDKATEVVRIIHGTVGDSHRHESDRTRALDEHLRVSLGKGKTTRELETYKDGIFTEEAEDEEAINIVDLAQVEVILRQIEQYRAQKDLVRAEQTYIELWQSLSESCRTSMSVEWHQKKIEVVQAYTEFLESQQRRVEATTLTTSLWREYEHHDLSYSESIVSRLNKSARFLKNVGEYSAALAIFRHASSYYKNVRKEDSKHTRELEEEMMVISHQALKATKEEKSVVRSEHEQLDMFHILIAQSSKEVDSSTMTLAKSLTSQFIATRQWSRAVSVVHSTLQKTWSSFMAASVHEVTMTSIHQKESIELVEQLALIYHEQRLFEKVEDVYIRLFRAALSAPKDTTLLEKAKNLLLGFYDRRGHADKSISVFQELLAVYRRILGPNHESTITVLYELATRCRAHARSHPYYIEYYQQIVTALNKDSTICHTRAIDAAIIVAESYWEERRYSDAVAAYSLIWNTFVHKHKEFKTFSQETFVKNLYERYYQCLEETKADFDVLRTVSVQYRETSKAVFSASSSTYVEATVALARVVQHSEKHSDESISLFEEASRSLSQSSSSSSSSINKEELARSITTIYKRRLHHSDSKSLSQETVSRATNIYSEQVAEFRKSYGYSHEQTLSSVRELSQLYVRQQKSELAVKELTTAVVEIVNKETSTQKIYESALSLTQTFQAASLQQQCTQLIQELHYQLITKKKHSKSSFSVVESSSAALLFLATMEYHSRKDLSITFSEIMASLKAESILYTNFTHLVSTKAGLDKVLVAASPLRYLLQKRNRTLLVSTVEHEAVELFVSKEAANVQLISKGSPRHFVVGIMDYLGNRKTQDFVRAVILASNKTVSKLIAGNQFQDAHDVAKMAFMYAQYRNGYRGSRAISRGFGLASQLDGRGENKCPDPELRKKLLQLSNNIIKDILKICKEQKLNLAQVQLSELNELIALLGEQGDYDTLETLLNELWTTREAQKTWAPDVLLLLGRRLISARYLAGRQIKALRLCEDIAYNLRRVNGIKHPATLETYDLLAQLYTSIGQNYQKETASDKAAAGLAAEHFKKAIFVHEDILRWLLNSTEGGAAAVDDDDDDMAATILAQHGVSVEKVGDAAIDGAAENDNGIDAAKRSELVRRHMHLLKLAYQRLGSWPKPYAQYEKLNADLFKSFGEVLKGAEGVEKWQIKGFGGGKAESTEGTFTAQSRKWEILSN
ncbi:hypothetical protein DOTSEDRAFT_46432 [Dothistroma septosporum NZE10]|uniref:Nephrocystin 3-like N-terminal domain-containing protein n=1 Tax=Dothistroma septosporum (strain NZE10 / CBS 128990) TaxID=675120 RepID=N1PFP5_DOTSN|nr:hypothetical protein DOTSEDRAFT_46432 [Dothistroma septosporum NZE10]